METDDGDGDLIDFSEDATMASLPAPMPLRSLLGVNESIVSLLLKLYAKLASSTSRSGGQTSTRRRIYRTPQEEGQVSVPSSRIGDGVHFVGTYTKSAELSKRGARPFNRIPDFRWMNARD